MKNEKQYTYIGNIQLLLTSDVVDGKILDTKVEVMEEGMICWICGLEIDNFIKDINEVITKYRI